MLDIKFVRENPEIVKENIKKKFQDEKLPLVDEVIELDVKYRAAMTEANELRASRNALSKKVGQLMGQAKKDPSKLAEAEEAKAQVKANADRLAELEKLHDELAVSIRKIMLTIPNIIDDSVPIGPDDSANVEVERFGEPLVPDYDIPYHTEIIGGYLVALLTDIITVSKYVYGLQALFQEWYVWYGLIKSLFFAFIIASVASFFGYYVKGGALDVGKASTNGVVSSSILILLFDVLLTKLLLQ